jgi:putative flavoprotein involved in K+ transport
MLRTDTIIIGGGQAGLAMSYCLAELGVEHVVLERGRIGERWLGHWDSLRLLSPNWQSRLPGYRYTGPSPDGFMRSREVAEYLTAYARSFVAPVLEQTRVLAVEPYDSGFMVKTDGGTLRARSVVIATGYCDVPQVPAFAQDLPAGVVQLTPAQYKNPAQLPDGGVLVVGASASGVQLADEIQRSGRQVTLAVGRHTRLPRHYRGKDICLWLDRMGVFDERAEDVRDLEASIRQPSLQLVGREDRRTLDLEALRACGVRLAGRALSASGGRVAFADDLCKTTRAADAKLASLLDRIDAFAAVSGEPCDDAREDTPRPIALRLNTYRAPTALNLQSNGIRTVLWATGYARSYPWLKVPVLDANGELRQRGGVTPWPGLYALGLRFQRRRKSSFLDGVGDDARELAPLVASHLGACERAA